MGIGIGLYFSLKAEPPLLAALVGPTVIAALLALLWRLKIGGGYLALGLQAVLCLSVGLAAAKIRTERIDAPV